ncbi:TonB-dependent receptor domain-containing protein [Sphingosinicella sp. CPCC 101087]|uniref:TonB-dependent receptor domain-containing protein n=1 Tax=Sphingosinicella sp. CPCC 101087 TaxID=2497754 RepID=UPI00101C5DB6|nr:TonB-dependent receptor [Sphingosinicella sp. CPCC 101087]
MNGLALLSRVSGIALTYAAAAPAAAQDNAVSSAADAFGERAGIEQSGLYTESQVRGFDLNDSGAYRIDDAYFSRGGALDDTVLSGVSVRVGVNAARLPYPAPSGVVNYRLREAGPTNELRLGAGLRDFGTSVVQGDVSLRDGALSLAGGFVWSPVRQYAQGYNGSSITAGAVVGWNVAPGHRLRAFASVNDRKYDGDYAVIASAGAMPPNLRKLHQYSPAWAWTAATTTNLGLLYRGELHGFTVDASAFRSFWAIHNADNTLISSDALGNATATTLRTPERDWKVSNTGEIRLGRAFDAGDFENHITLSLRGRHTTTELASALAIPLGRFDLTTGDPPEVPERPWAGTRGEDIVKQYTISAGYGLTWRDRVQLRFGAHRTRYDKTVHSTSGVTSERISNTTNYNVSAVVNLTDRLALFGSWVTGLEESGSAPATATNREEVLPPVEAEQFELGARYTLSPRLTLIAALFDVSKPSQGFRLDQSFGVVGEVRHRGFETSIAGELTPNIGLLAGFVAFDSKLTGALVDAGLVGTHDVGVSQIVANATIVRRFGPNWSLDATLSYLGERWVDTANTFKAPAVTTLSLGLRHRFMLGGRPADVRVLGSNLLGEEGYLVASSGLLSPVAPRTVRAVLTIAFGAND